MGVAGGAGAPEGSPGWGMGCPLGWLWAGAAVACRMARGGRWVDTSEEAAVIGGLGQSPRGQSPRVQSPGH